MKIILVFVSLLLPLFALKVEPKLCINCKHFSKTVFDQNKFGKCKLFLRETNRNDYLVDGSKPEFEYFYCSTARSSDDMCGTDGLLFDKKRKTRTKK